MLDWLGCLVMGLFVDRCSLQDAQLLFDALQKAAATVAIVVGGTWAYFKFARGRTFKPRLEPSVAGNVWRGRGPNAPLYLVVDCRAKNAGLTKFEISVEESELQVFTSATPGFPATTGEAPAGGDRDAEQGGPTAERVTWESLGGYPVFEAAGGRPLEPGEPAQDEILLELPGAGPAALKLELTVTARARRGRSWVVTRVVRLAQAVDNTQPEEQRGPDGGPNGGPEVNG